MFKRIASWFLTAAVLALPAMAQTQPKPPAALPHVGLREVVLPDPLEPAGIRTWLWYPTRVAPEPWMANIYLVTTRTDAAPLPGRKPLIVLSHGSFGYVFSFHHYAEYLAARGYIVATPMHPHDNNADSSGTYTDLQLVGRSRHIARTIDGVLRDPVIGPLVDDQKIGVIGFSAGGFTALTVLGGVPDFARINEYCEGNRDDGVVCSGGFQGKVRIERPDWHQTPDRRVKAAVLMAPGMGFMFPRKTLKAITRPVLMYRAASDNAIRHPYSEEWIAENLGRKPEYHVVPGEHLVFMAPCPPGRTADVCTDPAGVDRRAVHAAVNASMIDFFERTLR
jgi:predicted dienelactone hydrolase